MVRICTGCGRLNTRPLGLNSNGEPYLACCPDNSYKDVTAVEWLSIMLRDSSKELFDGNIWEQAKAMEKEQIIKARLSLDRSNMSDFPESFDKSTDYYNETYNK